MNSKYTVTGKFMAPQYSIFHHPLKKKNLRWGIPEALLL
jgi:hypothetical protein